MGVGEMPGPRGSPRRRSIKTVDKRRESMTMRRMSTISIPHVPAIAEEGRQHKERTPANGDEEKQPLVQPEAPSIEERRSYQISDFPSLPLVDTEGVVYGQTRPVVVDDTAYVPSRPISLLSFLAKPPPPEVPAKKTTKQKIARKAYQAWALLKNPSADTRYPHLPRGANNRINPDKDPLQDKVRRLLKPKKPNPSSAPLIRPTEPVPAPQLKIAANTKPAPQRFIPSVAPSKNLTPGPLLDQFLNPFGGEFEIFNQTAEERAKRIEAVQKENKWRNWSDNFLSLQGRKHLIDPRIGRAPPISKRQLIEALKRKASRAKKTQKDFFVVRPRSPAPETELKDLVPTETDRTHLWDLAFLYGKQPAKFPDFAPQEPLVVYLAAPNKPPPPPPNLRQVLPPTTRVQPTGGVNEQLVSYRQALRPSQPTPEQSSTFLQQSQGFEACSYPLRPLDCSPLSTSSKRTTRARSHRRTPPWASLRASRVQSEDPYSVSEAELIRIRQSRPARPNPSTEAPVADQTANRQSHQEGSDSDRSDYTRSRPVSEEFRVVEGRSVASQNSTYFAELYGVGNPYKGSPLEPNTTADTPNSNQIAASISVPASYSVPDSVPSPTPSIGSDFPTSSTPFEDAPEERKRKWEESANNLCGEGPHIPTDPNFNLETLITAGYDPDRVRQLSDQIRSETFEGSEFRHHIVPQTLPYRGGSGIGLFLTTGHQAFASPAQQTPYSAPGHHRAKEQSSDQARILLAGSCPDRGNLASATRTCGAEHRIPQPVCPQPPPIPLHSRSPIQQGVPFDPHYSSRNTADRLYQEPRPSYSIRDRHRQAFPTPRQTAVEYSPDYYSEISSQGSSSARFDNHQIRQREQARQSYRRQQEETARQAYNHRDQQRTLTPQLVSQEPRLNNKLNSSLSEDKFVSFIEADARAIQKRYNQELEEARRSKAEGEQSLIAAQIPKSTLFKELGFEEQKVPNNVVKPPVKNAHKARPKWASVQPESYSRPTLDRNHLALPVTERQREEFKELSKRILESDRSAHSALYSNCAVGPDRERCFQGFPTASSIEEYVSYQNNPRSSDGPKEVHRSCGASRDTRKPDNSHHGQGDINKVTTSAFPGALTTRELLTHQLPGARGELFTPPGGTLAEYPLPAPSLKKTFARLKDFLSGKKFDEEEVDREGTDRDNPELVKEKKLRKGKHPIDVRLGALEASLGPARPASEKSSSSSGSLIGRPNIWDSYLLTDQWSPPPIPEKSPARVALLEQEKIAQRNQSLTHLGGRFEHTPSTTYPAAVDESAVLSVSSENEAQTDAPILLDSSRLPFPITLRGGYLAQSTTQPSESVDYNSCDTPAITVSSASTPPRLSTGLSEAKQSKHIVYSCLSASGAYRVRFAEMENKLQVRPAEFSSVKTKAVEDARQMQATVIEVANKAGQDPPKYALLELIGKGSFGRVYKGKDMTSAAIVAVKIIDIDESDTVNPRNANSYSEFLKEVNALKILSENKARNINHVMEALPVGQSMWMITEYCGGGSIATLMKPTAPGGLQEKWIIPILREVAEAIKWVHQAGIIHRDIKCANVLITEEGGVQLCDFGVAGVIETKLDKRSTVIGTPHWMAPELFGPTPSYGKEVDIWAFGSMVFEIATGLPPNVANGIPYERLGTHLKHHVPRLEGGNYSNDLRNLVAYCLEELPSVRPTIEQVQKHPYIYNTSSRYPASSLSHLVRAFKMWEDHGGSRKSLFMMGGAQGPSESSSSVYDDEWNFSTTAAFDQEVSRDANPQDVYEAYGTSVLGFSEETSRPSQQQKASRRRPPPEALARLPAPLEKIFDPNTLSNYEDNSRNHYGRFMPPPTSDLPLRDDTAQTSIRDTMIDLGGHDSETGLSSFPDMDTIRADRRGGRDESEDEYGSTLHDFSRPALSDPADINPNRRTQDWKFPTMAPPASADPEISRFPISYEPPRPAMTPASGGRPALVHHPTEPLGGFGGILGTANTAMERMSMRESLIDLDMSLPDITPEITRPSTANSDVGSTASTASEYASSGNPFELERHASMYQPVPVEQRESSGHVIEDTVSHLNSGNSLQEIGEISDFSASDAEPSTRNGYSEFGRYDGGSDSDYLSMPPPRVPAEVRFPDPAYMATTSHIPELPPPPSVAALEGTASKEEMKEEILRQLSGMTDQLTAFRDVYESPAMLRRLGSGSRVGGRGGNEAAQ